MLWARAGKAEHGRFDGLRLLLAVAARPAEPGPRRALLDELLHDEAMHVCRLRPLSASASATMVRARLGAQASVALCDACHTATGGNPLLVAELARALRDDGIDVATAGAAAVEQIGPRTVARSVLVRLSRLGADAVALVRTQRCSRPSDGDCVTRCIRSRGGETSRSPPRPSATIAARASTPRRTWHGRGASAPTQRSAARCGSPGSSPAARRGSSSCARRRRRLPRPPRGCCTPRR